MVSSLVWVAPLRDPWLIDNWAVAFWCKWSVRWISAWDSDSAVNAESHLLVLNKLLVRSDLISSSDGADPALRRIARLAHRSCVALLNRYHSAVIWARNDIRIGSVCLARVCHDTVSKLSRNFSLALRKLLHRLLVLTEFVLNSDRIANNPLPLIIFIGLDLHGLLAKRVYWGLFILKVVSRLQLRTLRSGRRSCVRTLLLPAYPFG